MAVRWWWWGGGVLVFFEMEKIPTIINWNMKNREKLYQHKMFIFLKDLNIHTCVVGGGMCNFTENPNTKFQIPLPHPFLFF